MNNKTNKSPALRCSGWLGLFMKKHKELTFDQGYVCAVATLLRNHADTTAAKELLACVNPDWSEIDEYDREIITKFGLCPNVPDQQRGENHSKE